MAKRYFEDFVVGETITHGQRAVSAEEIVAFATEYDPQPFHLDPNAPETALTGGLIASGWHICAIFMRLISDAFLIESSSMGSPGVDTLKWLRPVRPGDTLMVGSTVTALRVSRSRRDRGIVRFRHEVINQSGEVVMWMDNPVIFGRRS